MPAAPQSAVDQDLPRPRIKRRDHFRGEDRIVSDFLGIHDAKIGQRQGGGN